MRWHYRDPLLLWLFPAAFGCHVVEEWLGGFPDWLALVTGRPLPRSAFVVINATALLAMLGGTRAAARREQQGWIAVAIATVALTNAILHLAGTVLFGSYSPGLFTGIVLYVPLGSLALLRAGSQADGRTFVRGLAAGLLVHAIVGAAAVTASYLPA